MAAFTENEMKDFKITDWYDLSGQVAVVTGGSTGLGLAITRCLVSAGAKVCVVSFESPEQAAEALEGFGDRTVFYQFDITDTSRAQELVDRIVQEHVLARHKWGFMFSNEASPTFTAPLLGE